MNQIQLMKIILLFILLLPLSLFCQLDSMEYQGSWYKIYPIEANVKPTHKLLKKLDLEVNEYELWLDWKRNKDVRLNQKPSIVRISLRKELIEKLLVSKDYFDPKKKSSKYYGCGVTRKNKIRRFFRRLKSSINDAFSKENKLEEFHYDLKEQEKIVIQSSVNHLPDGKYIQLFQPLITRKHFSKSKILKQPVAAIFNLKDDYFEGEFLQFNSIGDTLFYGRFKNGVKEGRWTTNKCFYSKKGNKNQHYLIKKNTTIADYTNGNFNGEYIAYSNNLLETKGNYRNGDKIGIWTHVVENDSVVYDAFENKNNFDLFNSYKKDFAYNYVSSGYISYDKKFKDNYEGYLSQELKYINSYSEAISIKTTSSSILDSIIFNRKDNYNHFLLKFNTFYKHYYKGKLLADLSWNPTSITLRDTSINTFEITGVTYYSNGLVKSKYKQDPNDPVRYFYTNDGRLYKRDNEIMSEFLEKEKVKTRAKITIDGFEVYQKKNYGKVYKLMYDDIESGDTLFKDITWNKKKELLSKKYKLLNTPYEINEIYFKNGTRKRLIYIDSTNELVKKEYAFNDFNLNVFIDNKIQTSFEFLNKNYLPLEGKIVITASSKEIGSKVKNGTLYLNISDENILFYPQNLQESCSYNSFKTISGIIQKGQFEGAFNFDFGKEFPVSILDYKNGMVNGNLKVIANEKEIEDYRYYFLGASWLYSSDFKRHTFSKDFIYKEYNFKNGKLNGNFFMFSSYGDTLAKYNYENGKLIGEQILKTPTYSSYLNYAQNGLNGEVKITDNSMVDNKIIESNTLFKARYVNSKIVNYERDLGSERNPSTGDFEFLFETCNLNGNNYTITITNDKKDSIQQFIYEPNKSITQINYRENSKSELIRIDSINNIIEIFEGKEPLLFEDKCIMHNPEFKKGFDYDYRRGYRSEILEFFKAYKWLTQNSNFNKKQYKKFYPNGKVAREGEITLINIVQEYEYLSTLKTGEWKFNYYSGLKNLEIDYLLITQSKYNHAQFEKIQLGTVRFYDSLNQVAATANLFNEYEFYNCSADNYSASREFKSFVDLNPSDGRDYANGKQVFYFDNGMKMSEGQTVNGMPDGIWKFYTPDGKLFRIGKYVNGVKTGRWLEGDLSGIAYIEDVCLKEDNPEINFQIAELQRDKEIIVMVYVNGELKIQQTSNK